MERKLEQKLKWKQEKEARKKGFEGKAERKQKNGFMTAKVLFFVFFHIQ